MKLTLGILSAFLATLPAMGASLVHGKAALTASKAPAQLMAPALPGADVAGIRLHALAKAFDVPVAADDKRLRVGVARDVALEQEGAGLPVLAWATLPTGAHVARVALTSPGAASLRLGLQAGGLPASAQLRFFSPAHPERVLGPVSGAAVASAMLASGTYWSPLTEGDEQQVEVWLPATAEAAAVRIGIAAASHIAVAPSQLMKSTGVAASQPCEEDVVCVASSNPALDRAARSVAKLLYTENGVSYLCSGTLVSDGNTASQVPYLYTAAHCLGNQAAAATLNTFWFFQAASCGGKSASGYKQLAGGATLLYANASTDASLLRLADPAPEGAWFSGWDRAPLESGSALVALHHPAGDLKKVSLGQALGLTPASGASGFNTAAWTSGTTEGGSSGSGVFTLEDGEYVLRGGLRGGSASCGNSGHLDDPSNRDYYSRIDLEGPQLEKWLSAAPAPLADHGGLWFDPDEPGWGVSIMQNAANHVFATWYGYDASRRPLWLVVPEAAWTSADAFEGVLYRTSASAYGEPYDASRFTVTPVGSMRVEFAPDGTARLAATIDGTPFERTIRQQPF